MAFGRGHSAFTIDTLKLPKDSLPAAVTEPPPVFPELLNSPHPLIENPINDYDYKLNLKLNFNSSFRILHDATKEDNEKKFILNKWKEEWLLLPRELQRASRIKTNTLKIKPNLGKSLAKTNKKKKTTFNIDLNTFEEKPAVDEDEEHDDKNDENIEIDENDNDEEGKPKDVEKKKLTDNENDIDGEIVNEEEEDMDEDEAADYIESYFDPGDRDDDDYSDEGGDGGD